MVNAITKSTKHDPKDKYTFSMQRHDAKKFTINGSSMPDVELVILMEQALKQPSSSTYKVKVDNIRWDTQYKKLWSDHINTIDHWNKLVYRYNVKSDEFVFHKKRKKK
jgi:hypothetical protein|tara:strand:- start:137 stop:460 length:324 start_codon:yes stop_codon:yes gene_type:complete